MCIIEGQLKMYPDYGFAVYSDGHPSEATIYLPIFPIESISFVSKDKFSIYLLVDYKDKPHALSADFDMKIMNNLLLILPSDIKECLECAISNPAFLGKTIDFPNSKLYSVRTKLGDIQLSEEENFIPVVIYEISESTDQKKAEGE